MTFEELIENIAEEVKDDWWHEYGAELVVDTFKEKLIDNKGRLQEVKHGEWVESDEKDTDYFCIFCSVCKEIADEETDYCPHCGARMDGNKDEF